MPTLTRFLVLIVVLAGLAYAAMFALTLFVEPNQAEMRTRVDLDDAIQQPQPQSQTGNSQPSETGGSQEPARRLTPGSTGILGQGGGNSGGEASADAATGTE